LLHHAPQPSFKCCAGFFTRCPIASPLLPLNGGWRAAYGALYRLTLQRLLRHAISRLFKAVPRLAHLGFHVGGPALLYDVS
jgi:hypothetical protein